MDTGSAQFPQVDRPNAALLLGPCVPAENDPVDGFWDIYAKEGRLGGHWASGHYNPCKKPVTMLRSGSVLMSETPETFYGRIVEGIHPDLSEVMHYGLAPALPVRLTESEVYA